MPPLVIAHFTGFVGSLDVAGSKAVSVDNAFRVTLRAFDFFPMIFSTAPNLIVGFFLIAIRADNH
jgi:hypothetical protein